MTIAEAYKLLPGDTLFAKCRSPVMPAVMGRVLQIAPRRSITIAWDDDDVGTITSTYEQIAWEDVWDTTEKEGSK